MLPDNILDIVQFYRDDYKSFTTAFIWPGIWDIMLSEDKSQHAALMLALKLVPAKKAPCVWRTLLSHGIIPLDPLKCDLDAVFKTMPPTLEKLDIISFIPKFRELNSISYVIYTDGACTGNGKAHAAASFATIVGDTYFADTVRGNCYKIENYTIVPDLAAPPVKPSNNRGELLGIIFGLLAVRHLFATSDRITIYTDSNYSIKTLLYYYPARIAKGTQNQLLNPDLLIIGHKLLTELPCVELVHIKAHQTTSACGMCNSCGECVNRLGNESADAYAGFMLGQCQIKQIYKRELNPILKKTLRY